MFLCFVKYLAKNWHYMLYKSTKLFIGRGAVYVIIKEYFY